MRSGALTLGRLGVSCSSTTAGPKPHSMKISPSSGAMRALTPRAVHNTGASFPGIQVSQPINEP